MAIDLNELAEEVAEREGKKIEINIGQIKEIMRCTFELLGQEKDSEILSTVDKYRK